MVRLSAGEKKKQLILDTCKTLFYQLGYENTTFADIAEKADIPQASITYHFDTKLALGLAIRAEFEERDYLYTHLLADEFNLNYSETMVVGHLHYWKLVFEDDKLRRFLVDISNNGIIQKDKIVEERGYYRPVLEECGITDVNPNTLDLMLASNVGTQLALLGLVAEDIERFTYEQVAEIFIKERFRCANIPDEVWKPAYEHGVEVFAQMPYDNKFYRDFKYEL